MSRKGPPESDRLWDELPAEDVGARRAAKSDPPDWALPSWDAIDDADTGAVSRPAESAEPAEPRASGRADASPLEPVTPPPMAPEQVAPAPSAL